QQQSSNNYSYMAKTPTVMRRWASLCLRLFSIASRPRDKFVRQEGSSKLGKRPLPDRKPSTQTATGWRDPRRARHAGTYGGTSCFHVHLGHWPEHGLPARHVLSPHVLSWWSHVQSRQIIVTL